jgi:hypothetical protein
MPINSCSKDGKSGYKWGDQGACYLHDGTPNSKKNAKKKALAQAAAIGEFENIVKADEMINGYPAATQDISVNIRNRQDCIDTANYGPMNPALPNDEFWQQKADMFKTSVDEAKSARCGNCAAFIQTSEMIDAMAHGLGGESEAYAIIEVANLGFCEIFDFKCAGSRTCDAWVVNGPITDSNSIDEVQLEETMKSLKEWFKEKWVDISRPKAGGGFEPCGRDDANTGKYPKCVPASRAARMTPEQIASAVRRKRTAESTQTRDGKKPIYVSTDKEKVEKANIPTDPELYARVKAEAKAKFDVYPSAYANAWLVREYKKRGGGYRIS